MHQKPTTNFRWFILSLLFIATTILYIDRSALGILAPFLQKEIGWTEQQYGLINSSFMVAYALCFLLMGRIIDSIGTRKGYLISIGIWSLATLAHTVARTWIGFAVSRFSLAVGQSGNFPSAIKAVAEWFPKKERALAIGIFNGGANFGTMLAPLVIPPLVLAIGDWRAGFLWTFPVSLLWAIIWYRNYRKPESHFKVTRDELDYILSDSNEDLTGEKVSWKAILSHKQSWAIAFAKFVADPIWWFYIFWGAKFLTEKFGVNFKQIGLPFFTIFIVSWGIGIALGWLSSAFLKIGWGINKGRKMGLLACGIAALPVAFVPHTNNLWLAVGLIALAAGGHCGWSANIFSLMSDVFPKKATASVIGIGKMVGVAIAIIADISLGAVLDKADNSGYFWAFIIAGFSYIFILGFVHLLMPKMTPLDDNLNYIRKQTED